MGDQGDSVVKIHLVNQFTTANICTIQSKNLFIVSICLTVKWIGNVTVGDKIQFLNNINSNKSLKCTTTTSSKNIESNIKYFSFVRFLPGTT